MSFVTAHAVALAAAAGYVAGNWYSALSAQNAAAVGPHDGRGAGCRRRGVGANRGPVRRTLPNMYQAVSAQATAIHEQFVNTLHVSSGSYVLTDAAIVAATD